MMNPLANSTVNAPSMPLAQPGVVPEQLTPPPELPEPLDAVVAGQVPAVPLPPIDPAEPPDPAQAFVIENFPALPELGLGVYELQDLTTVVYNTSLLDDAMLQQAEADGSLQELLSGPQQEPAMGPGEVAATRAAQRPEMPVQTAPAAPSMPAPKVPAGTQQLLAKARVRNMGAGPQTPGIKPQPLSNSVAKRPV